MFWKLQITLKRSNLNNKTSNKHSSIIFIPTYPFKSVINCKIQGKMPHKPRKKTTYVPEKATIPAVNKPPNCGRKRYVKDKQDEVSTFVRASNQRLEMAATLCHILSIHRSPRFLLTQLTFDQRDGSYSLYAQRRPCIVCCSLNRNIASLEVTFVLKEFNLFSSQVDFDAPLVLLH